MKKFVITLLACLGMLQLAGCNTMAGLGKDTQAAGRSLESAATKSKDITWKSSPYIAALWRRSIAKTSIPTRSSRSSS
jgi:predicted small secreted protein